jgi:mono/diheme cytochrome c family protein
MIFLLFLLVAGGLSAQTPSGADFFESRVRPIFAAQCAACHAGKMHMGGLNLSSPANILHGGESGPIISKDKPEESKLLQAIGYQANVKMPPQGKLKAQEIADITEWVKAGAPMPEDKAAAVAAPKKKEWSKAQKEFWSFKPVKDNPPPAVKNTSWVKTPIDNFILAKLEEKSVEPAEPAGKLTLLRRATFDLSGLPPTQKEIDDFLNDRSPDAFAKVVDRLLDSPRYGERWGRHWLDVARYADSTGADEDHRYPYAWRYRDYVIDAFNKDLPFDQFVRQQIAGDLLPAKDGGVNVNGIVATGFLSIGPRLIAEQDKVKMLYDFIDEQIDTTSRAFLGLTVACARCHDHKFDPIATKDYYSMASIFASTKAFKKIEGTVSQMYFAPLVPKPEADKYEAYVEQMDSRKREMSLIAEEEADRYGMPLRSKLADYMAAAWRVCHLGKPEEKQGLDVSVLRKWIEYLRQSAVEAPHLAKWLKADQSNYEQIAKGYQADFDAGAKAYDAKVAEWKKKGDLTADRPKPNGVNNQFSGEVLSAKGPFGLDAKTREEHFTEANQKRYATLKQELADLKTNMPPELPMACAVAEGSPVTQKVLIRGDAGNPGEEVVKRFPVILAGEDQTPITQGSGRLEFANWLTNPKHPLTSRVFVNRVWQWHFGEGLVRTPSNWGLVGEKPTNPELLDYLASTFIKEGWSVKKLHRMIMLSSTYQMSSQVTKEKFETDPANRLMSRVDRRRLDVEEIRDGMLMLDGSIDFTMGGTLQSGFGTDGENDEGRLSIKPDSVMRRTVYLPLRRSNLPTLLNLFDFGDATTTNEGRSRTNVAPQALFMMNSSFVSTRAKNLAKKLVENDNLDNRRRVEIAYSTVLARKPTEAEANAALEYVQAFQAKSGDAWQSLCRILLSSNEFVYVD